MSGFVVNFFDVSAIPSDGVLKINAAIQQWPSPPYDVYMQASIGSKLTNLFILVVRQRVWVAGPVASLTVFHEKTV